MSWNVLVWLECEQRAPITREQIDDALGSFLQGRTPGLGSSNIEQVPLRVPDPDFPDWRLFCYFDGPSSIIEAVDTAPVQSAGAGREWFSLLESHFRLFAMPWRVRNPHVVPANMLTAGQRAVEKQLSALSRFVDGAILRKDREVLVLGVFQLVHGAVFNYHAAIDRDDNGRAYRETDTAIYWLHRLAYMIGEDLGFIPQIRRQK